MPIMFPTSDPGQTPVHELLPPSRTPSPSSTTVRTQPIDIEQPPSLRDRHFRQQTIEAELCDGPLMDVDPPKLGPPDRDLDQDVEREREVSAAATSDRAELIERLKRGESPTWIPNRYLESILHQASRPSSPRSPRSPRSRPRSPRAPTSGSPDGLLPAVDITTEQQSSTVPADEYERRRHDGLELERPGSALHTGDFAPEEFGRKKQDDDDDDGVRDHEGSRGATSREAPLMESSAGRTAWSTAWTATTPPGGLSSVRLVRGIAVEARDGTEHPRAHVSSLSSSLASNFVYNPPTSPLVQSEVNEDLVLQSLLPNNDRGVSSNSAPTARRHTLTSSGISAHQPAGLASLRAPCNRRDASTPYRAHQPRRSTSSIGLAVGPPPPTPSFLNRRRPSSGSDSMSPLQHASMVGSYEESILRGRMSTTPSRPLEFLAQIGVLGLGKCTPGLRCPAHVTLPFHAVFYSYAGVAGARGPADDGPSPYVGQIDLENGLSNQGEEMRAMRKARKRYRAGREAPRCFADRRDVDTDTDTDTRVSAGVDAAEASADMRVDMNVDMNVDINVDPNVDVDVGAGVAAGVAAGASAVTGGVTGGVPVEVDLSTCCRVQALDQDVRRATRAHRLSGWARAPPGGSYRIPEKGQVQIVIKNQNKTAVKLFLVPYDLAGMELGTKTFIRQRSYSVGPIMDDQTAPVQVPVSVLGDERPVLRYLVQLHICCPSRGRFYLYKNVRVVFANRVPDGKERLRNETTWPEPRFSPYKPIRAGHPPPPGPATLSETEKALAAFIGQSPAKASGLDAREPAMAKRGRLGNGGGGGRTVQHVPSSGVAAALMGSGDLGGDSAATRAPATTDGTDSSQSSWGEEQARVGQAMKGDYDDGSSMLLPELPLPPSSAREKPGRNTLGGRGGSHGWLGSLRDSAGATTTTTTTMTTTTGGLLAQRLRTLDMGGLTSVRNWGGAEFGGQEEGVGTIEGPGSWKGSWQGSWKGQKNGLR